MKRGYCSLISVFLILLLLVSCAEAEKELYTKENIVTEEGDIIFFQQITAQEAKEIMETQKEYIIIDARTETEFSEGHIEGAILIPEYEIAHRAEKEIPDKDALILVYCRSGRRSKIASEELVKLGYTNVKEFGGIIDWPYEIVK